MSCPTPYASESFADEFFKCILVSDWEDYCPIEKQSALYNTALILDIRYGECYLGYMRDCKQEFLWPRTAFYQSDGRCIEAGAIPDVLKRANCMLAIKALRSSTVEEEDSSPSPGRQVKSHDMSEEGIWSETITYEDGDPVNNINSMDIFTGSYGWDEVDMLMGPILWCCPSECSGKESLISVDVCFG